MSSVVGDHEGITLAVQCRRELLVHYSSHPVSLGTIEALL